MAPIEIANIRFEPPTRGQAQNKGQVATHVY